MSLSEALRQLETISVSTTDSSLFRLTILHRKSDRTNLRCNRSRNRSINQGKSLQYENLYNEYDTASSARGSLGSRS